MFQLKKLQSKRSECLKWLVKWFSICLFFPFDLFVKFSSPQDRHGMECSNRSSHGRLKQLCSKYSIKQKETDKLILTFFIRVPTQFTFYYKYRNKREIKIVFSFIKILSNTHFFNILNWNIDLPDEMVEP